MTPTVAWTRPSEGRVEGRTWASGPTPRFVITRLTGHYVLYDNGPHPPTILSRRHLLRDCKHDAEEIVGWEVRP